MNDYAKKHSSLTCNSDIRNSSLSFSVTSSPLIGMGKVKKTIKIQRKSRKGLRLRISSSCAKSIREYVQLNGVRRSPRLYKTANLSTNSKKRTSKTKPNEGIDTTNKKAKNYSIEEIDSEIELKARRLVKKAIARSKFN